MTSKNMMEKSYQFAQDFSRLYLIEEEYGALLSHMEHGVTWINAAGETIYHNLSEVRNAFAAHKASSSKRSIRSEWICPVPLSEEYCLVFGQLVAQSGIQKLQWRYTIVCHATDDGMFLLHMHSSLDDFLVQEPVPDTADKYYRYVLESTTDAVFEVNTGDLRVKMDGGKIHALFHVPQTDSPTISTLEQIEQLVHPDDKQWLEETFTRDKLSQLTNEQRTLFSADFRVCNPQGDYFWINCTIVPVPDEEGDIRKYIGYFKNIDEQKRYEHETQRRAQIDSLTKLYNKAYTKERIDTYLLSPDSDKKNAALLVIDIDDFKRINDTLGHLLGDAVLCDLGDKMKSQCRSSDVVGRIGGDEFVVFLEDLPCRDVAEKKAADLIQIFQKVFLNQENQFPFSGSIGIALYPQDGQTYTDLFANADRALYFAKVEGKNQFRFYDAEMPQLCYVNPNKSVIDNANELPTQTENIAQYIFQTLYETPNLDMAIQALLGIVGRQFHVSRAYIFENTSDNFACVNTFEWCMEGIAPEKDNLQYVPYDQLDDYPSNFNENGIFYCTDITKLGPQVYAILEPQGISSMLQCAIKDDSGFSGYVGFDECSGKRFWTQSEVETLTMIAKVLSTFLLKKRSQEKAIAARQRTERMMDQLDLYAYVIDPASYRLLFLNEKTKQIAPQVQIGEVCYSSLRGKDAPCLDCPMALLIESGQTASCEIYNDILDVWTKATASFFEWENRKKTCLMSCFDITKYKKNKQ